jgi:hypothetical protein
MPTLLLRGPSRRPHDLGVSLRARPGCPAAADAMAALSCRAGCPPDVAARVRSAILHSGRYDCRIAPAAALLFGLAAPGLAPHDGSIELVDAPPPSPRRTP